MEDSVYCGRGHGCLCLRAVGMALPAGGAGGWHKGRAPVRDIVFSSGRAFPSGPSPLHLCSLPGELTSLSLPPSFPPGSYGAPGSFQGTPSAGEATVKPGACFRIPRPSQLTQPGNPGGPDAAGALPAFSPCPVKCPISWGSTASQCACPPWRLAVVGTMWGPAAAPVVQAPDGFNSGGHITWRCSRTRQHAQLSVKMEALR